MISLIILAELVLGTQIHLNPDILTVHFHLYKKNTDRNEVDPSVVGSALIGCAVNCSLAADCRFFSYNTKTRLCQLQSEIPAASDMAGSVVNYILQQAKLCLDNPEYKYEGPGLCIRYVTSTQNWQAARDTCQTDGASLLKIESHEKNNYLKKDYATLGRFWLGGNDRQLEGIWVWTDSTPIEGFLDWQEEEPDGGTAQNCMTLYSEGWYNGGCLDMTLPFLCELRIE